MKNTLMARLAALVLGALLALPVLPVGALARSTAVQTGAKMKKNKDKPRLVGYRLLAEDGNVLSEMRKNEYADAEVLVAYRDLTAADAGSADNIRVEKLDDAFLWGVDPAANPAWSGEPRVEVTSAGDEPLQLRLLFPHLQRQGDGKNLRFRIGFRNLYGKSRTVKIKIREFVKDEAAAPGETPRPDGAPERENNPVSRPRVEKCRALTEGKSIKKIAVGQTADLQITFKNSGLTRDDLESGNLTVEKLEDHFSAGDRAPGVEILSKPGKGLKARITFPGLTWMGGGNSLRFQVRYGEADLPGEVIRVDVRQCDKKAASAKTGISASALSEAASDAGLLNPLGSGEAPEPDVGAPTLLVSREAMPALKSGETASVTLTYKNGGDKPVRRVSASFSPSGALVLGEATASQQIAQEIKPGETVKNAVRLMLGGDVSAPMQALGVEVKYEYDGEEEIRQGSAAETVMIPAVVAPAKPDEPGESPAVPAPGVKITRNQMDSVTAGQAFTVRLTVKNLGRAAMETPVLAVTPTDSLMLTEGTASVELPRIPAGQSVQASLRMKALEEIQSANQGFTAEVKFDYASGSGVQSASATETVLIPVKPDIKDAELPAVIISRAPFSKPVKANHAFTATVYIKNVGKRAIEGGMAALTASEGLMLREDTSTVQIGRIEPGEKQTVTVNLKALKQITAQLQSVGVELKYDYRKGLAMEHETASERILIPAVVTKQKTSGSGSSKTVVDAPTPNIIVAGYGAGADQVAAGSDFPLSLTFKNTSPGKTVENIVMTLETGESFTITDASNTFYYAELAPGAEQTETIRMQALPGAKSGSGKMDVSFKYEYVDNKKRSSATITEKLSVPIYQPDRFNLSDPAPSEKSEPGEEVVVSIPYVNKGKSDVSNLEAELLGDVPALNKTVTLGNLEPGKSGTIDFILTPDAGGPQDLTVKVSYEDANQRVVVKEMPVHLDVNDAMEDVEDDEGAGGYEGMEGMEGMEGEWYGGEGYEGESGLPFGLRLWHLCAGGGAALILCIALLVRGRKRKKRAAAMKDFSFMDEDAANGSGEKP